MFYDDFIAQPGSGLPSYLVALISAGPLAAGESKHCSVALVVAPTAVGAFELEFHVNDGQVFIDDSNTANDHQVLSLNFGSLTQSARAIPASNTLVLILLLVTIGAAGMAAAGRWNA